MEGYRMHKNVEFIQNLTLEQKVDIILSKDVLRDPILNDLNIHVSSIPYNFDSFDETFLSLVTNNWNLELVSLVANEMIKAARIQKTNIIFTPLLNSKTYNEISNTSEEVFLSSELLTCFVAACHKQNVFVMGKYFQKDKSSNESLYETLDMIKNSGLNGVIIYNDSSFAYLLKNEFKYDGLIIIADNFNKSGFSLYSKVHVLYFHNNYYKTLQF